MIMALFMTTAFAENGVKAANAEADNFVASVSLGDYHNAAVTTNGDLYCWGIIGMEKQEME